MSLFNKKVKPEVIEDLRSFLEKFSEEFHQSFVPKEVSCLWYLGGHETLDALCQNELQNFNLHKLFDHKQTSLTKCLEDTPKVRKSFFYSLNSVKQNQNLESDEELLDFLKDKGKFFITGYLKGFQKSAEYYIKKLMKDKLPEYRELLFWVENNELKFVDRFFVYLGEFKINLDSITNCYKDDDLARTILKYTENGEEKEMQFNLAAFDYFEKILPKPTEEIIDNN